MNVDDEFEATRIVVSGDHEKVAFIVMLIREFRYDGYKTVQRLARLWGVETSVVTSLHQQAMLAIQTHIMEHAPSLPYKILEQVEYVVSSAMNAKKPFMTKTGEIVYADSPDHRAAITGLKTVMDAIGMGKKDSPLNISPDQFESHSLEELLKLAVESARPALVAKGETLNETSTTEVVPIRAINPSAGGPNSVFRTGKRARKNQVHPIGQGDDVSGDIPK